MSTRHQGIHGKHHRGSREKGYAETLSGRRRHYPDLSSGNAGLRANAERAAINMPIQGTSADMIKLAMIKIDELLRKKPYQTKMLLQVHDELVFDLHPEEEARAGPQNSPHHGNRPSATAWRPHPRGKRDGEKLAGCALMGSW